MADPLAKFHEDLNHQKNDAHASGDTSGFMATAQQGMRDFIRGGPIGPAVLQAGDEAYQKFHGPGPNET